MYTFVHGSQIILSTRWYWKLLGATPPTTSCTFYQAFFHPPLRILVIIIMSASNPTAPSSAPSTIPSTSTAVPAEPSFKFYRPPRSVDHTSRMCVLSPSISVGSLTFTSCIPSVSAEKQIFLMHTLHQRLLTLKLLKHHSRLGHMLCRMCP